jgi:hypothetical protein
VWQVASARKTAIDALDEGAPAEARQLAHAVAAWEGLLDSIFDSSRWPSSAPSMRVRVYGNKVLGHRFLGFGFRVRVWVFRVWGFFWI